MSDTSEITNGCLTHYDSQHIQVRKDFMGLSQYNHDEYAGKRKQEPNQECMAKILRILETLTDHAKTEWKLKAARAKEKGLKAPKAPKRYLLEISNNAIVLMIYRTFGESTVRNSLNYLESISYIGSRQYKKNATPFYWLELDYVQGLLKCQAEVLLAGYEFRPPSYQGAISYPDGVTVLPKRPISNPEDAISDGSGCESTDNNIGDITEESSLDDDKEGTGAFAPTPAPADALREKVAGLIDTAARLRAIRLQQEQAELEETVKRPAVRIGGKDATVHGTGDRDVDRADAGLPRDDRTGVVPARGNPVHPADMALATEGHQEGQAQSGVTSQQTLSTLSTDGAAPASPSAGIPPDARTKVPKRPKAAPTPAPKGPPVMPAEDAEWTTRTCLQLFDAWRGAYLIGKFEQMKASTCAKELVAQYSRAEVEQAKAKMDRDKYWMERGGADVCNVAGQIHRYCRRGKAPAQAAIDDDPYSFANILKRQEEEQQRAGARGN